MTNYNGKEAGFIHSIETAGMVDGPGIRFVVFFQGCSLRCKYCHNPDTWKIGDGKKITVDQLLDEALKYRSYMKFSGGGITITGGEPFVQPRFLIELLKGARSKNIHTTIDTSGFTNPDTAREALKYTNLLILDLKSFNPQTYKELTGVPLQNTLYTLEIASEMDVPAWIRFVLVDGITDDFSDMQKMADYLRKFNNIEQIEVLPFHKMGEYKWEQLGIVYELADTQPPDSETLKKAQEILGKSVS